eukprot:TRINITY_DN1103_c0_g2_i1.p1 TRINITY_DN1103_c0_g2~~TRINITY_DN1103_c0_g2_i1.p1  ORF type:complete len:301 (-),score=53.01 TRINITY_DN1103_c0_g2_i1:1182-1952(-)
MGEEKKDGADGGDAIFANGAMEVRLRGRLLEGAYYAEALLGSQRQKTSLIVDTGSWMTATSCSSCTSSSCGTHQDRHFNLARSKGVREVPCGPSCAGVCQAARCAYRMKYLEGSSLEGAWVEDDVRFLGAGTSASSRFRLAFGCSNKETGLFRSQRPSGILGLAPGSKRRPTLPWQLREHRGVDTGRKHLRGSTDPVFGGQVFSLCLQASGGWLVLGDYQSGGSSSSSSSERRSATSREGSRRTFSWAALARPQRT